MPPRPYRQQRRLSDQQATRRRIVEATAALHVEVGPAATTISAIAERAGVQRLTVYRHFPDDGALFGACAAHWSARHPTPDSGAWAHLGDPRRRLEAALAALYAFYRSGEPMLSQVLRDAEEIPALAEVLKPMLDYVGALSDGLVEGWRVAKPRRRILRAAIAHAITFETWRSFALAGLQDEEAVRLMAEMVAGAARPREQRRTPHAAR